MDMLRLEEALQSLEGMNGLPSVDTLICALQKCREEKSSLYAKRMHLHMCHCGLEAHKDLGNFLVPMLVDCGSVPKAQQVFRQLVHSSEHSWTSLIQGFNECGEWQHAVNLYQEMLDDGIYPSKFTFAALLKACARLKCIKGGQEVHAEVTKKGFERDLSIGNTLVDMYAKCGSLAESQEAFDDLPLRDVFSWTALAAGYVDLGFLEEALTCFEQMQVEGVSPNAVTYLYSLKACGSLGAIDKGCLLHSEIAINGFESVPFVGSALVGMYVKCGSLAQAQEAFDELSVRDVVLWNSLLAGYAEHGLGELALNCWEQMKLENLSPDAATFVGILKACSSLGAIERGQEIHADCVCKGLRSDPYVSSTLVDMYVKCGCLSEAQQVFNELPVRDVVLWTGLIAGYAEHGLGEEALNCLEHMHLDGVSPNSITFACSLKACGSVGARHRGQEIHIEAVKKGFERDLIICGSLVDLYAKCGLLAEAQELFDGLPFQDVVSWNILIAGYVEHGLCEEGFKCFQQMQQEDIPPSAVTLVSTLKACSGIGDLEAGQKVYIVIVKQGIETDLVIGNILVDMYAKCGSLAEAEEVFNKLPIRDTVSWTALIQGYADQGLGNEALKYLEQMQLEGVSPDIVTFVCSLQACSSIGAIDRGEEIHIEMAKQGLERDRLAGNTLVDMYAKFRLLAEAWTVFDKVLVRDVVSWNTLIQGYAEQGLAEEALSYFQQMQLEDVSPDVVSWNAMMLGYVAQEETAKAFEIYAQMQERGVAPNNPIFANLLTSCGNTTALQSGKRLHSQIYKGNTLVAIEVNLATNLIDMYGKCGSMEDAQQVFDMIPKRDLVAWNALVTGYARQGKSDLVFCLYERMKEEDLEPNEITCLSLLSACRHAGLVEKGRQCFEAMSKELGIAPNMKHYTCTIDLLGRAGRLDEIVALMEEMPFYPNIVIWHTVMSACQKYGDLELGRQAFECARRLGEKHAAAYIFMSNIYADAIVEGCDTD